MSFECLCRDFLPLEASHRAQLEPFLVKHPQNITGFTFDVLMMWSVVYRYSWSFLTEHTLLIACCEDGWNDCHMLQPVGCFGEPTQEKLIEAFQKLPYPVKLFGVTPKFLEKHPKFASHFDITEDRDNANYLYNAEELATLPGRRFQKKRNLVNQAQQSYPWKSEALTTQNIPECIEMMDALRTNGELDSSGLLRESKVVDYALRNFASLKEEGIVIRSGERVIAFAMFETLKADPLTAVVHFEKALPDFKGLYQLINRETSLYLHERGYKFINREEDLGIEGLRQAKLSYNPTEIISVCGLTFRK